MPISFHIRRRSVRSEPCLTWNWVPLAQLHYANFAIFPSVTMELRVTESSCSCLLVAPPSLPLCWFQTSHLTICLRGKQSSDKTGVGISDKPHDLEQDDDEFDAYRKRMMLAYRFRPNPLVSDEFANLYLKVDSYAPFIFQNNPRRSYYWVASSRFEIIS